MPAPDQSTIDKLQTAVLSIRSAAMPLDEDDPLREEIDDAADHVERIIGNLKRLRDNK